MDTVFDTACYPQQQRGMLVCGINWGGSAEVTWNDPNRDQYYPSFFSDTSQWVMNSCKYRSRVLEWLKRLGMDLEGDPQKIERFEKSVSQRNWLSTQSVGQTDSVGECARNDDFFFANLAAVNPSLVLFLSVDLLRALNAGPCLNKAETIFGKSEPPQFQSRDLILKGKSIHV